MPPLAALSNRVATNHMWLLKLKLSTSRNYFLCHSIHILRAQWLLHWKAWLRPCLSLQSMLLDSTVSSQVRLRNGDDTVFLWNALSCSLRGYSKTSAHTSFAPHLFLLSFSSWLWLLLWKMDNIWRRPFISWLSIRTTCFLASIPISLSFLRKEANPSICGLESLLLSSTYICIYVHIYIDIYAHTHIRFYSFLKFILFDFVVS